MAPIKIDVTDRAIIRKLQKNGRITNSQLAAEIGISPSAMLERVKRLENSGIIHQYVALVNPEKVGKGTLALVSVSLAMHQYSSIHRFETEMEKIEEVLECYHIAGEYDFVLKIAIADMKYYEDFLIKKLSKIEGINKIHTSFILSTIKYSTAIPLS